MQVSGYVLLALTFVGLSFSLRKRRGPEATRAAGGSALHLGLFWLFPMLLLFHILAVYYY